MAVLFYIIIGFIISVVNWLILTNGIKDHVSLCIALPLGLIFWPAIIIGWVYRIIEYIVKLY